MDIEKKSTVLMSALSLFEETRLHQGLERVHHEKHLEQCLEQREFPDLSSTSAEGWDEADLLKEEGEGLSGQVGEEEDT